jgi:tRNA-splicing ligase RtcB
VKFRGKDLTAVGIRPGPAMGVAMRVLPRAAKQLGRAGALAELGRVAADPGAHADHPQFADVAAALQRDASREASRYVERETPAPYRSWATDVDQGAIDQMENALRLPSAVRGALMPDAHVGYGLPIGGVLATEGTVVPYAVGVDIACRMKLSVLDLPPETIDRDPERLERALLRETQFGVGAKLRERADHGVLDRDRWSVTPTTRGLREKAADQLGTSGSGNHFVEFGVLDLPQADLGLQPGRYLAVLSHSGSRGAGAQVASHYSKRARELHPDLPRELAHLAWLDLDSEDGQGYWAAMSLMGDYAGANHAVIHQRVARHLKADVLAGVENHHNYAWMESHDGRDVVVHRKGATPADAGVLGVIPGSMASPAYVVRGRGVEASLHSAAHGAGRVMSRTAARQRFNWKQVRPLLEQANVRLLAAGIDENPLVYRDIDTVIAAQQDLVDVVARFDPRIVRMADAGERPED